ncbi:MAG: hypothetical protein HZB80_10400 [Deltaproteobacteria bacterium]|nr:hypothetical protein [Deltaproteobacteria bacterium]
MEDKDNIRPKRAVGLRVFGIILFFLGVINIMFSFKAGIEVQGFYIFLIAAGAVLFATGVWKNRKN